MILYLIKSSICLAVILAVYHLLLEREKMHYFNRYYLLIGLVIAFVAPLMNLEISNNLLTDYKAFTSDWIIEFSEINLEASPITKTATFSFGAFLRIIYLTIFGLFLIQFVFRLGTLIRKVLRHQHVHFQNAALVLVEEEVLPHTFGNFIFLNREEYEQGTVESELLTHELAHAQQRHTLDVILIELLKVVFWFNPLIYFYKRAIQLNHEFLADDAVIKNHQAVSTYQHLLLDKASTSSKIYLASNLNFLLTKKRLNMMTKKTSRWKMTFLSMLSIPMFATLLLLFSNQVIAQTTPSAPTKADELAALKKIKDNYFKDAVFVCEENGKNRVYKSYEELTEKERAAVPPPPPPPPSTNGKPTKTAPLSKGTLVYFDLKKKYLRIGNNEFIPPPPPPAPPAPPKAPPPPPAPDSGKSQ